jgi:hypothetical protein
MDYFDPSAVQGRATFSAGYQNGKNGIGVVTTAANGWPASVIDNEFGVTPVNVYLPDRSLSTFPLSGLAITLDIKLSLIELAINAPVGVTMADFIVQLRALDSPVFSFMPVPTATTSGSGISPEPKDLNVYLGVMNGGYTLELRIDVLTFNTSTTSPVFWKAVLNMVRLKVV